MSIASRPSKFLCGKRRTRVKECSSERDGPDNSRTLIEEAFARLQDYIRRDLTQGEESRLPEVGRELPSSSEGTLASEEIALILRGSNWDTCRIFSAHRRGLSYGEIARYLGVSERTVQFHIARAMLILMQRRGGQD